MRVMGIDPSTSTGVAILDRKGYRLTRRLHWPDKTGVARLHTCEKGIQSVLEEGKPDLIYIEGYGFQNKFTLVCLVEIGTTIRLTLSRMGYSWVEIPPTRLKLWATGTGKASKDVMAEHVNQRWGFTSPCHDVVDAYALAQLGLAVHHDGLTFKQGKKPCKRKPKTRVA